jgi:TatA/E family protein of Tat protein translocase
MYLLFIGFDESLLILTVVILLFGPKKIISISRQLGYSIKYIQDIINQIKKKLK